MKTAALLFATAVMFGKPSRKADASIRLGSLLNEVGSDPVASAVAL